MGKTKNTNLTNQVNSMRRIAHEETVAAMRDGVRLRPQTFKSGKEYRRKPKHGRNYE